MRRGGLAAFALALAVAGADAAAAYEPVGPEFRISETGADGDIARGAGTPDVAYNSAAGEYLVVWAADALPTVDEAEIFGQRLNSAGVEVGPQFRISTTGADGDASRGAARPAVTYNPTANEYLVVWDADDATDEEREIWGQRLSATGVELGLTDDFRISNVDTDGDADFDGIAAEVAYSPAADGYLATWRADGTGTDNELEIFGQRLSSIGLQQGGDFRISSAGVDGDASRNAAEQATVWNPVAGEYLVAWEAEDLPLAVGESEIYGQRISPAGAEVGVDDFRISNTGADGDPLRDAESVDLVVNAATGDYLATWSADGLATDDDTEIFGQRLAANTTEIGGEFRISSAGPEAVADRVAVRPDAAYSSVANEFVVSWYGDGLATDEEYEVFAQRLAADGAELGADFRISNAGTDGDPARASYIPALSYSPAANEFLAVWYGDPLATDDEIEVSGRRLGIVPPAQDSDPPETTITAGPKRKLRKSKAKLRFTADEPGSSFECRLKGKRVRKSLKRFADCDSPVRLKRLKPGKKKFEVRAIDPAGNVDPSPAKRKFKRVRAAR